jgi:pyruvate dehydrogenase E2 component (dihydrolipoamide acetyltransferase)
MVDFLMPSLGSDMEAATLVEWKVEPGGQVTKGDIVAVVETQKGAIDIEVFDTGTVAELLVPVGEEVPVGTPLARIDTGHEEPSPDPAPSGPPRERPRISPRARRKARELGVQIDDLAGAGRDGTITGEDVERTASRSAPGGSSGPDMQAAIGAAMERANRDIPHYYLAHEVDLTAALDWLKHTNTGRSVTERLLPIAPIVFAVARALAEAPELNGHFEKGGYHPADSVNLAVAVSLRGGGLVAPTIHGADGLSLDELMLALRDLTARARGGKLRSSDLSGSTATLTNLGERGVDSVFGVIYPPQVALIGCGAILDRPWVVDGAIVPRKIARLSLAADHRASNGHRGARFLAEVASLLEHGEFA